MKNLKLFFIPLIMVSFFALAKAADCPDFFGVWSCSDTQTCRSAQCSCPYTPTIYSWDVCTLVPTCDFNGTPFLSWQIATGYKFVQFGSLTDLGNYQTMTCLGSASWSPTIGSTFIYSRYTVTAPAGWYCPSFFGTDVCSDQNRCNNPAWCSCNGFVFK